MTRLPPVRRTIAGAALALLLAGCGSAEPPQTADTAGTSSASTAPTTAADPASRSTAPDPAATAAARETADEHVTLAAEATTDRVEARESPDGEVVHTFGNPTETGVPLTFLVLEQRGEWVQVQLPVRPNGTTGWVPAEAVELMEVPYRLEVSTADNTLTLYERDKKVKTYPVATGTGDTPTPLGTYYLTELIAPTNEGYGPYAYGISAFSEVLSSFGAGPGQIGLHGTDDASSIGRAVSHGCIRLSNEDITELAQILPLGTPIVID